MSRRLLVAGDIGGTKANVAVYAEEHGRRTPLREATLACADFDGVGALLRAFPGSGGPPPHAACFGVAGPVRDGRVTAPNLPWAVDAGEIGAALGTPRVTLVNDLVATALGVPELPPECCAVLQEGRADPEGNGAVIAAGTGLGQALLFRVGGRFLAAPSEGGHASFAPTSDLEAELLRFLATELGHVSVERVASGRGLRNVYRFLTATGREPESPRVRERMAC
ncbi:MAG: glucokinase, partial [Deltaproteobacteria bacterium]|nr:glucokinase [Deltaproteobacteria bacterium]